MRLFRLFLLACCLSPLAADEQLPGVNIFVARDGNDENSGIIEEPKATVEGALRTLREFRSSGDITPDMPVNIWIRGGRYAHERSIVFDKRDDGTEATPFRVSAYRNEEVIFDGRITIDRTLFAPVRGTPDAGRLGESARSEVLVATVPEGRMRSVLDRSGSQLSLGDQMLQVARFPDTGFTIMERVHDGDETNAVGTREAPKGALISFKPAIPGEWAGEVNRTEKARLSGYISATWLKQSMVIASLNQSGQIRLRDGSAYGMPPRHICRAYLENVLPALDRAGEWFYDSETNQLFIWPPSEIAADATIGAWAGPDVFVFNGCSHVSVERIIMENLGGQDNGAGAVQIRSGTGNRAAGCTFRNIEAPMTAFNVTGGTNNGILSCDIYDVGNASRLSGGSYDHESISHAGNYIENCHFTQLYSTDFYGKVCGINGAGNIFRNNLAHNHNGQIVTMSGVDHLVERNEVFNTGVEEGDGGAFYQGAMLYSFGNTFRHNFFHHIMCVPEMYTRAAIFSDDGDCGDICYGNVFFKAGEGFKSNGGSGHYVHDNIAIEGINAVYLISSRPKEIWERAMKYFADGRAAGGEKNNLIGNGLRVMGKPGWEMRVTEDNWHTEISDFWYYRYPRLRQIVDHWRKKDSMEFLSELKDNHAIGWGDRSPFAVPSYTIMDGNTTSKRISTFEDPDSLDFSYRRGKRPKWAPEIPFNEIGILHDEFRATIPEKAHYRRVIREHWKDERSHPPREYDVDKVAERSYFNTGKLLLLHTPQK